MKRYLIFIFVLFYFSAASGATVEFHYCMGKLVEWGWAQPEETENCSNCKMSKQDSKDCCKKDQQQVKIEKAQKAEFNFQFSARAASFALPVIFATDLSAAVQASSGSYHIHAPPRTYKTPVFLMFRSIRV